MNDTILYVSPHLDDVVFSCPGHLIRHQLAGCRTIVATLFTQGDREEQRKQEDLAALRMCGAEHRWLDLKDCPVRNPYYDRFSHIVFGERGESAPDLQVLIDEVTPDAIVGPLGVGTHIDHRLAFDAVRKLGFAHTQFYEERPYCLIEGATELRLHQLGYRIELPNFDEFWTSFLSARYVQRFLQEDEREYVRARYREVWECPPGTDEFAAVESASFDNGAIGCYASQLEDFVETDRWPAAERMFSLSNS